MPDEYLKAKILELIRSRTSDNPISSSGIFEKLLNLNLVNAGDKWKFGAKLRSIINEFRCDGHAILASGEGYYWPESISEVVDYVGRLTHRWLEIKKAIDGLKSKIPKDRYTGDVFETTKGQV